MAITEENKEFIGSLLEYYISEAESYRQIAENFAPSAKSVEDTAFGIIAGCVYSGFLQAYQSQQESPGLEDVKEFYRILNGKAPEIRKAVLGQRQGSGHGSGDGSSGGHGSGDGSSGGQKVDPGMKKGPK